MIGGGRRKGNEQTGPNHPFYRSFFPTVRHCRERGIFGGTKRIVVCGETTRRSSTRCLSRFSPRMSSPPSKRVISSVSTLNESHWLIPPSSPSSLYSASSLFLSSDGSCFLVYGFCFSIFFIFIFVFVFVFAFKFIFVDLECSTCARPGGLKGLLMEPLTAERGFPSIDE
jgi:hypothetical protein